MMLSPSDIQREIQACENCEAMLFRFEPSFRILDLRIDFMGRSVFLSHWGVRTVHASRMTWKLGKISIVEQPDGSQLISDQSVGFSVSCDRVVLEEDIRIG